MQNANELNTRPDGDQVVGSDESRSSPINDSTEQRLYAKKTFDDLDQSFLADLKALRSDEIVQTAKRVDLNTDAIEIASRNSQRRSLTTTFYDDLDLQLDLDETNDNQNYSEIDHSASVAANLVSKQANLTNDQRFKVDSTKISSKAVDRNYSTRFNGDLNEADLAHLNNPLNFERDQSETIKRLKRSNQNFDNLDLKRELQHISNDNENELKARKTALNEQMIPMEPYEYEMDDLDELIDLVRAKYAKNLQVIEMNSEYFKQFTCDDQYSVIENDYARMRMSRSETVQTKLNMYSNELSDAFDSMKSINYKRCQVLFQEMLKVLKNQQEQMADETVHSVENFKKSGNIKIKLKLIFGELMRNILQLKRPLEMVKFLFREELHDDFKFKQYIRMLMRKYRKYLFNIVLNDSLKHPKMTRTIWEKLACNDYVNICTDGEQLDIILNYLKTMNHWQTLADYKRFYLDGQITQDTAAALFASRNGQVVRNLDLLIELKMEPIEEKDHLIALNSAYLIYIQQLLNSSKIYDDNKNDFDRITDENKAKIEKIIDLIRTNLKRISIYDETRKFLFIQSFRTALDLEEPSSEDESPLETHSSLYNASNQAFSTAPTETSESLTEEEELMKANELANACKENLRKKLKAYETFIVKEIKSATKWKHLFNLVKIYYQKKPFYKAYALKAIDYATLALEILRNDLSTDSKIEMSKAYEMRGLINKRLSDKYSWETIEKLDYLTKAKRDFIRASDYCAIKHPAIAPAKTTLESAETQNFVNIYKQALREIENEIALDKHVALLFDRSIELNPFLYEAHFQRLLALYELSDLTRLHHLADMFKVLQPTNFQCDTHSENIILQFFKLLINTNNPNSKQKKKRKISKEQRLNEANKCSNVINDPVQFVDQIFGVKIKNQRVLKLYVKLIRLRDAQGTEFFELNCNNRESLNCLLRNGKSSVVEIRKHKELKEKIDSNDLRQMFVEIERQTSKQVDEMEIYCKHFESFVESAQASGERGRRFVETELDVRFLKTLPDLRRNLVYLLVDKKRYDQAMKHISRALVEYDALLARINKLNMLRKKMLENVKLKTAIEQSIHFVHVKRADIYRQTVKHYCEESELNDRLLIEKRMRRRVNMNQDGAGFGQSNPMIYFRLASIVKMRRAVITSSDHLKNSNSQELYETFINKARRRFYEKQNKKIFKKVAKYDQKESLTVKNCDILVRIVNVFKREKLISIDLKALDDKSDEYKMNWISRKTPVECLALHFTNDQLNESESDDHLAMSSHLKNVEKIFQELIIERKLSESMPLLQTERLIDVLNGNSYKANIQLITFNNDQRIDLSRQQFGKTPIIIIHNKSDNTFRTAIGLNLSLYFTSYRTISRTITPELVIKNACTQWLTSEIRKSHHLPENTYSGKFDEFGDLTKTFVLNELLKCKTIKCFSENILFYLLPLDEENNVVESITPFELWSELSDLGLSLETTEDSLKYFKEVFIDSIDEFIIEKEKRDNLEIGLIDENLRKSLERQKQAELYLKIIKQIREKLEYYQYIGPTSAKRQKLQEIMGQFDEFPEQIVQLADVLDIELDDDEKSSLRSYLSEEVEDAAEIELLEYIEAIFEPAKLTKQGDILIVRGHSIFLSEWLPKLENDLEANSNKHHLPIAEVQFIGICVFADLSIDSNRWHGVNLSLVGEVIDFVRKDTIIDLSGINGNDGANGRDGKDGKNDGENGTNGAPGEDGEPGQNGGNFSLIAQRKLRGSSNVKKIRLSGGEGGKGGNGGNGGNGTAGKDGKDGKVPDHGLSGSVSDGYYNIEYGTKGTPGGNGGSGGAAGVGAYGGQSGFLIIEMNGESALESFSAQAECKDHSTTNAEDGKPGEGGKGALGGADGYDEIIVKRHFFTKSKTGRGRIKVTKWSKSSVPFAPHAPETWDTDAFDKNDQRHSKRGIDQAAGKSAEDQLNDGTKRRSQARKKNQSKKGDMKAKLKEAIDKNESRTNDLNAVIEDGIERLQQEHDDLMDQKGVKQRAQQKNSQFLKKTQQLAQQVKQSLNTQTQTSTQFSIITDLTTTNANWDDRNNELLLLFNQIRNKQTKLDDQDIIRPKPSANNRKHDLFKKFQDDLIEKKKVFLNQIQNEIACVETKINEIKQVGKNICFKFDLNNVKSNNGLVVLKLNEMRTMASATSDSLDNKEQLDLLKCIIDKFGIDNDDDAFSNPIAERKRHSKIAKQLAFVNSTKSTKTSDELILDLDYLKHFQQLFDLYQKRTDLKSLLKMLSNYNTADVAKTICLEFGHRDQIESKFKKLAAVLFKLDHCTNNLNGIKRVVQMNQIDLIEWLNQSS